MDEPLDPDQLRRAIGRALRKQGYRLRRGAVALPDDPTKDDLRRLHLLALQEKLRRAEPGIRRYEDRLLKFIANGDEVVPSKLAPHLVQVQPGTESELLFRYAYLHWSIPVSAGYGRRLRFLVMDDSNGKLIGVLGLRDPVYAMRARDEWIGWDAESKRRNLYHVMDAHVLGAVPPYSRLLCGKLVAMLALSNEVRRAFARRYANRKSVIKRKIRPAYLALVMTTSAFGRSSLYNRIRIDSFDYWHSVGFTQGSGEFHFSNGVYGSIRAFVDKHCEPYANNPRWGTTFRNKREIIQKCLDAVGLHSKALMYHGVPREVFMAPLGSKAIQFLRGEVPSPHFYDFPARELAAAFHERWLLARAERVPDFRDFNRELYRLWPARPARVLLPGR